MTRALKQVRFGRQQLPLGSIDVLLHGCSCQSRAEVRSGDTSSRGAAVGVLRDLRALTLAASKEQQESRNKKSYQGERRSHRFAR
jgi:hypothetical protein